MVALEQYVGTEMITSHPASFFRRDESGVVWATAPSDAALRWMLFAVEELAKLTSSTTRARVVVDLSSLTVCPGAVSKSIFGEHAAMHLGHCDKVACLVPPACYTGVSEAIAQQRGLNMRVFTSVAAVRAWLAQDGHASH
jgi:hypothetical protein